MPEDLIIEANRASAHYWRDLWRFRELLGFLAWRDLKVRYKQAVLGVGWVLIQPLVQTVLLTFVFGKLAGMHAGNDVSYPVMVVAGLMPWQLFSTAFSGAGGSLINNAGLISKIYFPRLIVPIAALAVALVDMLVQLAFTLPYVWWSGARPTLHLLMLPVFILATLVIALGAGLWITALTVKYRDFRFISPFLLQIGIFVTPVGYRSDLLNNWRRLLAFNPLTGVVDGFRWCLLGGRTGLDFGALAVSFSVALVLTVTGVWYFRKVERQFADII